MSRKQTPHKEFKIIVINKPVELRKRMNSVRTSTNFNKEIENVKKTQSELNNTISE